MHRPSLRFRIALALLLGSCAGLGHAGQQSTWREFVATIAIDLSDEKLSSVDVPERVPANLPFQIEVTTYVGDCDRAGRTEVRTEAGVVHVKLYREYEVFEQIDGVAPTSPPCTLQLGMPVNEVQIPALQAGHWEVRVAGMHSKRFIEAPITISRFVIAE